MKRALCLIAAVAVLGTQIGCSFFVSSGQSISVMSSPDGADVTIHGNYVGATPLHTDIPRDEVAWITVDKDGYRSVTRQTNRRMSMAGVFDIIGGCIFLLPFFGLLSAGAYKQEPESVTVNLQPL